MRHEPKLSAACKLTMAGIALSMISACGQPEPLQTVSDTTCLAMKRISAEPAPAPGVDDPGNQFDTDQTFGEILAHNAAFDRLCPPLP